MPWDDDAVLTVHKMRWREEAAVRVQNMDSRGAFRVVREFFYQLYALLAKNVLMLFTQGRSTVLILVVTPFVCTMVLGSAIFVLNQPPAIENPRTPFYSVGNNTDLYECAYFDPWDGVPVPSEWCATLAFAPARNTEVRELMDKLAVRHDLAVERLEGDAVEAKGPPKACEASRPCLLGFDTGEDMSKWIALHEGRLSVAVAFVDRDKALNGTFADLRGTSIPKRPAVELWYNASALRMYRLQYLDLVSGENGTSKLLLATHHAVEDAFLAHRLGDRAGLRIHFKRYPMIARVEEVEVARYAGLPIIYFPLSISSMLTMVQVVSEAEEGLLSVLRSLGLQEGAWWLSFALQQALINAVVVTVIVVTGTMWQAPFIAMTDLNIIFGACWWYGMAIYGLRSIQSAMLRSVREANQYGMLQLFTGFATTVILSVLVTPEIVDAMNDPTVLPRWVYNGLQFLFPSVAMHKILHDILIVTRRTLEEDPVTGINVYVARNLFTVEDFFRVGLTGEHVGRWDDTVTYRLQSTASSFFVLVLRTVFSCAFTWYIAQARPMEFGRPRHPLFFLSPSFWLLSTRHRGNPWLLADLRARVTYSQFDDRDVDVAAEAYAVLGGNLSEERKVVVYDLHRRFFTARSLRQCMRQIQTGGRHAVRGVSVSMQENEVFTLLGHNGAGKSTLINMLTGHIWPTSGDAIVYSASIVNDGYAVRRMTGTCPQHDALINALSARSNLQLVGRFKGVRRAPLRAMVDEVLADVRLTSVAKKKPMSFSGGMKRRLSVALAYIGSPKFVVLDEPTTGMDPYNRQFVWDMISRRAEGRTTLLTTHSMEEAEALGHTIAIMSVGQLVALGSSVHLKRRFGAGYTIKLVSLTEEGAHRLQERIGAAFPPAELITATGTVSTYSIADEHMGRAGTLLNCIEDLKHKSDSGESGEDDVLLKDWLITHTTLDEVFIRIARNERVKLEELNAMENAGEGNSPTPGDMASVDESAERGSQVTVAESADARGHLHRTRALDAAVRKNISIIRRQPIRNCVQMCFPFVFLLALIATEVAAFRFRSISTWTNNFILQQHVTYACENVTRLFDDACNDGVSLQGRARVGDVCGFCAQPDYESYVTCCVDSRYWADVCVTDQCTGHGPAGDAPDFDSDCVERNNSDVQYPRPYCDCKSGGSRSDGLQARIDETPSCKAVDRLVRHKVASAEIVWLPAVNGIRSLREVLDVKHIESNEEQVPWLGWRIPVFISENVRINATISVQDVTADENRGPLGTMAAPYWSDEVVFPSARDALLQRASDISLTSAQVNGTLNIAEQVDATGLTSDFPRAIARTSFLTSSNQPTTSCTVSSATVKCCYEVSVGRYDEPSSPIRELIDVRRWDVCGALGAGCPERYSEIEHLLSSFYGWSQERIDAEKLAYFSEPSDHARMGISAELDFDGRPTPCASDEPPICTAVRNNNGTTLTCALIRTNKAEMLQFAFVDGARWTGDEWDDDGHWTCESTDCVRYEAFSLPVFTRGEWRNYDELAEHFVLRQARVQSNWYKSTGTRIKSVLDFDWQTTLNIAEEMFPSWTVDAHKMDISQGFVELTIASFYRFSTDEYFYVTEPLYRDLTASTSDHVRRYDLERPFALQGRLWLENHMPSVLQNALTGALLRAADSEDSGIDIGLRPMNGFEYDWLVPGEKLLFDALAVGLLPCSGLFFMPGIVNNLVSDKEYKVGALMTMMGLPLSYYFLVEWIYASFIAHVAVTMFWGIGIATLRIIQRSFYVVLVVLHVWAQLQIALGFLMSVAFQRVRPAAYFVTVLLVLTWVSGVIYYALVLTPSNSQQWMWQLDLYPPFAFFHCIWISALMPANLQELLDPSTEIGLAFMIMALHIVWTYPLALYLASIVPREIGVPRSPLFPFHDLASLVRRLTKMRLPQRVQRSLPSAMMRTSSRDEQMCRADLTRDNLLVEEDPDVAAERLAVEKGEYPRDAPVQIFSLRKVYGHKVAVNNLTLKIEKNECFGLLGPNGAGKTTTLSILTGLDSPTSGSALVGDHDIRTQMRRVNKIIGVCPQYDILWPDLTVREHILFYSRVKGVGRFQESEASNAAATSVGLQQVVFLDEPTTGLDPETRRLIWQLIEDFRVGRVIVLTTHSMEEVDALCNRIGIMANGELKALGTTVQLKNTHGRGYKVDVTFMPSMDDRVHQFVLSVLPGATVVASGSGTRTYRLTTERISLAQVFRRMDNRPESAGIIHWVLRQTSLEEVFIRIAGDAEAGLLTAEAREAARLKAESNNWGRAAHVRHARVRMATAVETVKDRFV